MMVELHGTLPFQILVDLETQEVVKATIIVDVDLDFDSGWIPDGTNQVPVEQFNEASEIAWEGEWDWVLE